jgi:hypothetical protein
MPRRNGSDQLDQALGETAFRTGRNERASEEAWPSWSSMRCRGRANVPGSRSDERFT